MGRRSRASLFLPARAPEIGSGGRRPYRVETAGQARCPSIAFLPGRKPGTGRRNSSPRDEMHCRRTPTKTRTAGFIAPLSPPGSAPGSASSGRRSCSIRASSMAGPTHPVKRRFGVFSPQRHAPSLDRVRGGADTAKPPKQANREEVKGEDHNPPPRAGVDGWEPRHGQVAGSAALRIRLERRQAGIARREDERAERSVLEVVVEKRDRDVLDDPQLRLLARKWRAV